MPSSMELLAPAGDLKIFKSAINAGADAVYFGGDFFGARASAANFSVTDAKNALDFAHARRKKAYLTVNTLLKNTEMEGKLYDFMKEYYEAGIDGVIIQDFGVFTFLKDHFPELELHASTQMSLMSRYGAQFLKDAGAKRIVTARELSLKEIKDIHENVDVEIEAFVHGALCVCYSGNCLMSSFIGGRSGNRGYCAQPCRLPYELYDEHRKSIYGENKFHLSPKDLWGIYDLPGMLDAGVYSYKIEGRLKNEAYVTNVVSVYRKYMDLLLEEGSKNFSVDEKDLKRLVDAGNRGGFTNLYFTDKNGSGLMDDKNSAFYQENKTPVNTEVSFQKTPLYGEFVAHKGRKMSLTLWNDEGNVVTKTGGICEESKNQPTSKEEVLEKLCALGEVPYVLNHVSVDMDANAFIPLKFVKALRRDAITELCKKEVPVVLPYRPLKDKKNESKHTPMIRIGISKEEQLLPLKEMDFSFELVLHSRLWLQKDFDFKTCKEFPERLYVEVPVVIRSHTVELVLKKLKEAMAVADGFYAASFDGLQLLKSLDVPTEKVYFSDRLYAYSNRSIDAFERLGYRHFFAPLELNEKELSHRYNATSEMMVYGYVPLMYTANCISKLNFGCKKKPDGMLYLKDRKDAWFPVYNQCEICTNVIYNSLPLLSFDKADAVEQLGFAALRLDFTMESQEEEQLVLKLFFDMVQNKVKKEIPFPHTKGHLKRGVL